MLEGTRVVELGVWVAGPSAGGVLADWGADVIKVEAPTGDPMRRMLAAVGGGRADAPSPPFDLDNRGKRSMVLDLADATGPGRQAMDALLATADVFVTNLRPEAVARLGLDPVELMANHPRLVYAGVTGYGRTGPDAHRAGYDIGAFWARTGLAATSTPAGDAPNPLRGGIGDHVTGIVTVAGILAALHERATSGRGRLVDTSLLRTGTWCLGWDLGIQLRHDTTPPTVERTHNASPTMNCYQAADGAWFWLLGLEADRHWPGVCAAVDRPDLLADERFATSRDRRHHSSEAIAELDATFATRTRDEWVIAFDAHDVWWAPVLTPAEVVTDPQALAAGAFVDVPAGAGSDAHRAVATPVRFADPVGGAEVDAHPAGGVPGLGEHTAEILAELGLN